MNTPTPRTDAAWAASFSPEKPSFSVLDVARTLERELATERARLDWVFRNCKVTADDFTTGNRDVYAIHDREDLGAAMKEDAK
jgi:hypothetical protein